MEEQRQRVMQALGPSHVLTARMRGCGEIDDWDNMKLCGVPTCPRCFLNHRRRQTGQAIKKTFLNIPNEQLGFLTVLVPEVSAHLYEVSEIIKEAERKLRSFVTRSRRRDPRWNAVHLVGYWELDRIRVGDIPGLGQNTQRFLRDARGPKGLGPEVTLWLPHFHAVVALGEVSREEFAEGLRGYGHGASHQVDLRMFDQSRRVQANLQSVIRYANKFRVEDHFKRLPDGEAAVEKVVIDLPDRRWWPNEDIKALTEWLCLEQKGFRSLRFVVGVPRAASAVDVIDGSSKSVAVVEDVVVEEVRVRVRARYNIPLQDTNWLVRPLHLKARVANDDWKVVDDLFEYGDGRDQSDDGFVWCGGASVEEKPMRREVTGEMLRAIFDRVRQRCA
jgi:hypothetical protein